MRNTAFVFSGQGSQCAGMGLSVLEQDPKAERYFREAEEILGMDLLKLCCEGTEEQLRSTDVSQPAILLVSYLRYLDYRRTHVDEPLFYAGHSLGEYTALLAAGVLTFPEAIRLIGKRATCMKYCVKRQTGTMMAVVCHHGYRKLLPLINCFRDNSRDSVSISCFNSHSQIVIAGDTESLTALAEELKQMEGVSVFPLQVEGAFHSLWMADATEEFAEALANAKFEQIPSNCGILSNVTGVPYQNLEELRANLLMQLTCPVHWLGSVEYMREHGADIFIEFGAKPTLSNLIQKEIQKHAFL